AAGRGGRPRRVRSWLLLPPPLDCSCAAASALCRGVNAPRCDDAGARPGARAGVGDCSQAWIRRSRRPDRLPLVPRSGLVLLAVAGLEAGDAAAGVQDLLLAGVE